jgi:hypothetical protein
MMKLGKFSKPRPTETSSRELFDMNPSNRDASQSNQETQAFDPQMHGEEAVHPAPGDDEKEGTEKSAQIEEDRERAEAVTKEVMLRVNGGQL